MTSASLSTWTKLTARWFCMCKAWMILTCTQPLHSLSVARHYIILMQLAGQAICEAFDMCLLKRFSPWHSFPAKWHVKLQSHVKFVSSLLHILTGTCAWIIQAVVATAVVMATGVMAFTQTVGLAGFVAPVALITYCALSVGSGTLLRWRRWKLWLPWKERTCK